MLTAEGCAARRERLWEALPAACDVLIVGDPSHLIYFAGYVPSPFVFRTVESAALLLLEPGRATLVADDMLGPFLDTAVRRRGRRPDLVRRQRTRPRTAGASSSQSALDRLAKIPGSGSASSWRASPPGVVEGLRAARPGLEIVDIGPIIRPLRRSKDPDEIEILRRSMRAGEAAQAAALAEMRARDDRARCLPDRPERRDRRRWASRRSSTATSPPARGRATDKGGPPTSRKIEPGDLLLLDFSVVVSGYRGDFTNTFAVGGGADAPPARAVRGLRRRPCRRARPA